MGSNRIYHGCGLAFEDGAGPLIKASLGCCYPTANPFWKDPEDVENRVKTKSQLRKTPIVKESYITEYLNQRRNIKNKKVNNNLIITETVSYP